eukprot:6920882-Karenia_brevis.AAC.1
MLPRRVRVFGSSTTLPGTEKNELKNESRQKVKVGQKTKTKAPGKLKLEKRKPKPPTAEIAR